MHTATPVPFVLSAEAAEAFPFLGQQFRVLVDGDRTGGTFAAVQATAPRGPASPLHVQPLEDETFFVLDGRITVHIDGAEHVVEAGGVAFVPRGTPHAFHVDSERATVLVLNTPAGHERFFRALAHQEPTPEQLAAAATDAGFEILGPPPFTP